MQHFREHLAAFFLAIQFLTRIPIPESIEFSSARSRLAAGYYPAVGLLIGAVAASVWSLTNGLGHALAILLSMTTTIAITGAFHEDGLADTLDSFGGRDRNTALSIMRDSRLGTYGVVGLVCVLALKAAALIELQEQLLVYMLLAGHTLSRFSSMMVARTSHYVRDSGIAKPVAEEIATVSMFVMSGTCLIFLATGWILFPSDLIIYLVIAVVIGHFASRQLYERRLSGYTGDCLGATQQITELFIYLGAVLWL